MEGISPGRSVAVRRLNAKLGGREVMLPSRLLFGMLPSALLEAFRFWQGEDFVVRGYPRNPNSDWFPYHIELVMNNEAGAHDWVATVVRKDGLQRERGTHICNERT